MQSAHAITRPSFICLSVTLVDEAKTGEIITATSRQLAYLRDKVASHCCMSDMVLCTADRHGICELLMLHIGLAESFRTHYIISISV